MILGEQHNVFLLAKKLMQKVSKISLCNFRCLEARSSVTEGFMSRYNFLFVLGLLGTYIFAVCQQCNIHLGSYVLIANGNKVTKTILIIVKCHTIWYYSISFGFDAMRIGFLITLSSPPSNPVWKMGF